ncbi:MAG: hypothetical protein KDE31_12765, partial [Caldilineaceae bacterium]|nr:hypothetical protein [Caldilineaceae bacterium]
MGSEVSFKRTDLALFDLNAATRTITCRLVEVKCYTGIGELFAFNRLRDEVAGQIQQSEQVIRWHFDPQRKDADRPDRLVKSHELALLLEFYLDHAIRYGIVAAEVATEARLFLYTLENGYKLAFTRSALIFDLAKAGTEAAEQEQSIEYHRIGSDLVRQLIQAAAQVESESTSVAFAAQDTDAIYAQSQADLQQRRSLATAVPTLTSAAFLSSPRDRTVAWEAWEVKRKTAQIDEDTAWMDALLDEDDPAGPKGTLKDDAAVEQVAPTTNAADPITYTNTEQRTPARSDETFYEQQRGTAAEPAVALREPSSTECYDATAIDGQPEFTPSEDAAAEADTQQTVAPAYDIMLGVTGSTPQYGLLGELSGRKVAIDLNQTHTISLFGVQGGGKSYTLGT